MPDQCISKVHIEWLSQLFSLTVPCLDVLSTLTRNHLAFQTGFLKRGFVDLES